MTPHDTLAVVNHDSPPTGAGEGKEQGKAMPTFKVILASGLAVTIKAQDADVAIFRVKSMGFDAVNAIAL